MRWIFCEAKLVQVDSAVPGADAASAAIRDAKAAGPVYFWSYVFYLSKYVELLDTLFVVLRGSAVPHFGLQVYHHALVLPMMWLWLESSMSLQHIGLLFNTGVHVVMYLYYALVTLKVDKRKLWWKRYITRLQIVQFVTSFCCMLPSLYFAFGFNVDSLAAGTERQRLHCRGYHAGEGEVYALWLNALLNLTMLKAFVGVKNHGDKSRKIIDAIGDAKRAGDAEGEAEAVDAQMNLSTTPKNQGGKIGDRAEPRSSEKSARYRGA